MKKLILILTILFAQTNINAQSLFDKYEDIDDITSIIVTDEMFKLIGEIEPEGKEAKDDISVLKDITGLKIFTTENENLAKRMRADAAKYIGNKKMVELMRIKDKEANVKFYFIKGKQAHHAKELIMVVHEKEDGKNRTVVMLVTGNIDLKKLSKLNSKVKVVHGKYLEKVEEHEKE